MKVMITGSKGQLGKELTVQLKTNSNISLILTDVQELDITDFNAVSRIIKREKPDIIINCAAHTNVDLCEDDVENAWSINTEGAKNLAIASNEAGADIIQISTDYVFDGTGKEPYTEVDKPNPQSVYGKTKLEGERAVIHNNPHHYIIRTAWLYGEGRNFVRTMLELSKTRDALSVVNDQTGTPTSTIELAKAIILLMFSGKYGIYHGTCEGSCTWYEFALKIFEYAGIRITVNPCTSDKFNQRAKRPEYSVMDNRNFREKLGYRFSHWEDALKEYMKGELK